MSIPDAVSAERHARTIQRCAIALMVIHGLLLGWVSYVNSPNLDEPAHLASGISHWTFGRFDLYRVNPPLVRLVAAAPVMWCDAKTDWSGWMTNSPYSRSEFHAGTQFVIQNGMIGFWYFTLARWACIPLCLVGLWTVYLWAKELYGAPAGLTAMGLYCFCPNCIAWGASITPDAAGASLGVFAAYSFWKWLRDPVWPRMLLAGLALGFAEAAKGTWVILFVLWPAIWLVFWLFPRRSAAPDSMAYEQEPASIVAPSIGSTKPRLWQLAIILLTAVYIVNLSFGFEETGKRLKDFVFVSRTLSGQERPPQGANRFADSWVGLLPVPFPANYVRGLDVQKGDFERGKWSYLCGEQKVGGWWYYYLIGFLVKSPIASLVLFTVATLLALGRQKYRSNWRNELMLLLPAAVVFIVVSSQTGFSRYLRYALPVLPFAYIHISRVAVSMLQGPRALSLFTMLCCLVATVESLAIYPHSMSFFNQLAGGASGGSAYLVDANIDWGQDLLFLKKWYDQHPEARPLHLVYFGHLDISPAAAGIESQPVPGYLPASERKAVGHEELTGPQPGWFAVSVNHLRGYHHYEGDRPQYTYFQRLKPVAQAGYSIYIYHLTESEATQLRQDLDQTR